MLAGRYTLLAVDASELEHGRAVDAVSGGEHRRHRHPGTGKPQVLQQRPTLQVGPLCDVLAVNGQHVEHEQRRPHLTHQSGTGPLRVHPPLQQAERRPPIAVEGDDLAVEDRPAAVQGRAELVDDLRVRAGEWRPVAARQPHTTAIDHRHRTPS